MDKKEKVNFIFRFKGAAFIITGVFSAAFGLKGFLLPNGFVDGGVMGISLLVTLTTKISLPFLIIIINLPFIILGYKHISKSFAITTGIAIAGLALLLLFINFPIITKDNLLIAIFGGFFLGAGIGMCIRGGCVIDGTEIFSIIASKRSGFTIGDILLIINIIIFSAAAFLLDIETALYSILIYMVAGRTVDYIVEGIEEYTGVIIICNNPEEIRISVIKEMGRGVTILKGRGGYGKKGTATKEMDILYCVITRLELSKLKNIIERVDENAFVVMHSIKEIKGGMIKRRLLR